MSTKPGGMTPVARIATGVFFFPILSGKDSETTPCCNIYHNLAAFRKILQPKRQSLRS